MKSWKDCGPDSRSVPCRFARQGKDFVGQKVSVSPRSDVHLQNTQHLMLFAAALSLYPHDHDGQLSNRRRISSSVVRDQPVATARCGHCSGLVPMNVPGHWPPWCPKCGAKF
jgi:hypothetical protein